MAPAHCSLYIPLLCIHCKQELGKISAKKSSPWEAHYYTSLCISNDIGENPCMPINSPSYISKHIQLEVLLFLYSWHKNVDLVSRKGFLLHSENKACLKVLHISVSQKSGLLITRCYDIMSGSPTHTHTLSHSTVSESGGWAEFVWHGIHKWKHWREMCPLHEFMHLSYGLKEPTCSWVQWYRLTLQIADFSQMSCRKGQGKTQWKEHNGK